MKNLEIILASNDRLEGRLVAVHLTATSITGLVNRDHIDSAIIPGIVAASRAAFANFRRRATPTATPALRYHLLGADMSLAGGPIILDPRATPGEIIEYLPRDSCTPEMLRYASQISTEVQRWYEPPPGLVGPSRRPPPPIPPYLLAKEAS
ncbi:hypothetical protein AB0I81_39880 [Nonomuraea sp. NPDC050404]|uniref:hypothetical protein n=1 Tax=Nonomuraea sp. NPDC050404 TaxID=3155783 RepID=UPI0033FA83B4